jgi:peptidyl-prolyl cis-trans isomerase D
MGAFPEIIELEDGGIFALRLDAIVPPAPIPLDEARDAVEENWRAATEAKALSERAIAIKSEVEAGASLGGFGILDVNPAITRSSTIEDVPANLVASVFEMDEGEIRVFDKDGFIGILKLDSITPGALDGEDAVALKAAISAQAEQAIAQDAFSLFTNALTTDAGISLNNAAISAVHAQFQ